ncbi:hypothetical protein GGX14DRAFT_667829 [Mycena pura]|uniref:Uncharacterized protein n=1 Tax=Mycena pura TaxID=153505 RepID=A0AAD6V1K5_9AGAR|nr:hypothetical protein GGX14DRAFT_667829 [Mycena pura]
MESAAVLFHITATLVRLDRGSLIQSCNLKRDLPGPVSPPPPPRPRRVRWLVAAVEFSTLLHFLSRARFNDMLNPAPAPAAPAAPNGALWSELMALHAADAFLMRAAAQLSAAIQTPTETFDEMGPWARTRAGTRAPMHLRKAFPHVHEFLHLEKTSSQLLPASTSGIAPHTPAISTVRPAPECEPCGVIGVMCPRPFGASLIASGRGPSGEELCPDPHVLSFGFDEGAGGIQGAGRIAPVLRERYGPDSFGMIIDEGHARSLRILWHVVRHAWRRGEGRGQCGHRDPGARRALQRPTLTSIGMLAAMVMQLEDKAPQSALEVNTVPFEMARCLGAHAHAMPRRLQGAPARGHGPVRVEEGGEDAAGGAYVSRADKHDASGERHRRWRQEQAAAVVNYRIVPARCTSSRLVAWLTTARAAALVRPLAAGFNLSVTAFGEQLPPADAPAGALALRAQGMIEPAPVTPAASIFVSPGVMVGSTDTRHTWALSRHIFRYAHNLLDLRDLNGMHTVNERIRANAFVEMITFFTTLILNANEAALCQCCAVEYRVDRSTKVTELYASD